MTPLRAALAAAIEALKCAKGYTSGSAFDSAQWAANIVIRDHGHELLALLDERDALRQDAEYPTIVRLLAPDRGTVQYQGPDSYLGQA